MDFVIAIKTEPNRVVKKNATNNITLLVSPVVKAADKTILHRDNAYLNKLEGTCFKCSKLSEIPPVEVCNVPNPAINDPGSCLDQNSDNYCNCFNCHSVQPIAISCLGSFSDNDDTVRYPAANSVTNSGSGYWVGLQANNFYSNPLNGGWVVAVECSTSQVVGAFPVSSSNFGYGVGNILGYSVMIYPAGIAYGAGLTPWARTSFPILAQNTADGDELITTGFNLTGPNLALGVPYLEDGRTSYDPTGTYSYFCNTGPAIEGIDALQPRIGIVTGDRPKPCLSKYGTSTCPQFNSVLDQPNESPGSSRFFFDLRTVDGIDLDNLPTNDVFLFETSEGKYSSVIENIEQFENFAFDAIFGVCSTIDAEWQKPSKICDNCSSCVCENIDVPCQFVNNLTMGDYSYTYGGYSAAGVSPGSYAAIGPSNPPVITNNIEGSPLITNYDFWENYWDWDHTKHHIRFYGTGDAQNIAIIPPISELLGCCICGDSATKWQGVLYLESIADACGEGDCSGEQADLTGIVITKPGKSCNASCKVCPRNDMQRYPDDTQQILGRSGDYARLTCCPGKDTASNPFNTTTVTQKIGPSIWWLNELEGGSIGQGICDGELCEGEDSPIVPLSENLNESCINGIPTSSLTSKSQNDPCLNVFVPSGNGLYTFDSTGFENCSGFLSINDPCFKSEYLPNSLQNVQLSFTTPITSTTFIDAVNVTVDGETQTLRQYLCGTTNSNSPCPALDYLEGPLYPPPSLGVFAPCNIPITRTHPYTGPGDDGCNVPLETVRLNFIDAICDNVLYPDYCDDESINKSDPCGCCSSNIAGGGIVNCSPSSGCPECCSSGGCQNNSSCSGGPSSP